MTSGNLTVCGLYINFVGVRQCAQSLKNAAIRPSDISVLLQNGSIISAAPIANDSAALNNGGELDFAHGDGAPGVSGSLTRTLLSLGIPVYDSERLGERIHNGGVLVLVRCNDIAAAENIKQTLIETGARDFSLGRKSTTELHRCTEIGYPAPGSISVSYGARLTAHRRRDEHNDEINEAGLSCLRWQVHAPIPPCWIRRKVADALLHDSPVSLFEL